MEVKTVKKLICIAIAMMLLLSACAGSAEVAPTPPPATTAPDTHPPETDPPITEPPVTEPPETEPPPTEPPMDPNPFLAHEKFDAAKCASLLGTWTMTVTLDWQIQNLELFTGKTTFELHYTFDENGYFRAWADQKEFDNAIDDYEAAVIDHMVDLRYITFKGPLEYQGVEEEEIIRRWMNGPELEARVECEENVAALNLYHRFKKLLREGQYYVNGSKLYTQISEDTFETNSFVAQKTALTLRSTDQRGTYRDICLNFPLVLWKSE